MRLQLTQPICFTVNVNASSSVSASGVVTVTVTDPSGVQSTYNINVSGTNTLSGTSGIFTLTNVGSYSYSWKFAPNPVSGYTVTNNATNCPGQISAPGPNCPSGSNGVYPNCHIVFSVVSEPYISVIGGDVAVGSVISSTSGNCTDPKGLNTGNGLGDGILTFNKNTLPFTGSGTNMAVQALYYIDGFVSNQNYPANINKLTLANKPIPTNPGSPIPVGSSSIFGGTFGEAPCPPDITIPSSLSANPPATIATTNSLPKTNTLYTGSLTINAVSGDEYTGQATIYVNGDVYINGDQLNYSLTGWNSLKEIPSLRIVATGDIYINPSITSLDGTYIAQGNIFDCATPQKKYGGLSCYSNNLTVNGSFMANAIYLQRTGGNINSTGTAAETFNYGPEDWLAPAGNLRGKITSYNTLNPVL